jgi:GDP-L-fucose synthase
MKPLDQARVLVTGGAGFLGSNLIARLLARGARVRATLHQRPAQLPSQEVEWMPADLTSLNDCRRVVEGMDYVFLCAANTSGAAVMKTTPLAHVTPNVVMNTQMMEAAYQADVQRLLFISSSAAYPETDGRPAREGDMFLGDPPDVYYPVGWMKRYAEILCGTYATRLKRPMPCVVIRPSNVYGPYDKFDFQRSHVTAALLRKVVERQQPLEVWGTGDDVRDLIFVDDFLEGLLAAFQAGDDFLVVNIASGTTCSVKDILQTLLEVDGYTSASVRFNPDKPSTIPRRSIDASYARERLGFAAKTSLSEGLRQTIAWYRNHQPPPA